MIYYVSKKNTQRGNGTAQDPFQTIKQAADIARAGDNVVIGEGIYREWVNPLFGGISDKQRVTYIAAQGEKPVISGAEELSGWEQAIDGLWKKVVENTFFGEYNPFGDVIYGDWYDDLGQVHHTGEVYIDGKTMYEVGSMEALSESVSEEKKLRWYAEVTEKETSIWCNFQDADPNSCLVEVNARPFCFFPSCEGVNYITVSGLSIRQAATQWAPPTAFQPGAIGTHWSKGWVIENCIIHDSKCSGISIGKRRDAYDNVWSINPKKGGAQTYTEVIFYNLKYGWSKDSVGGHIIRNNEIYNCGQTGIVGNMGCAFCTIEKNHIHDINTRLEFEGYEIAGIKLHAAIDTRIADNCIHDCNRGIWLDWQAQGTRLSRNVFFANAWHDLFIEVCHGPCVIDNNLFLSKVNILNISQGTALVHNLFAGKLDVRNETTRFSLYHLPHDTYVGGVMLIYGGDDRIANNIFFGRERKNEMFGTRMYDAYPDMHSEVFLQTNERPMAYTDSMLPVDIHDNLYFNDARQYKCEQNGTEEQSRTVEWTIHKRGNTYELETNLFACGWGKSADFITTDVLGSAFQSEARYENPDGTDIIIDEDFTGKKRVNEKVHVGPFEEPFTTLCLTPKSC